MSSNSSACRKSIDHNSSMALFSQSADSNEEKSIDSFEDALVQLFVNEDGLVPVSKFLMALDKMGLKRKDPRLKELMDTLVEIHQDNNSKFTSPENMLIQRDEFKRMLSPNVCLLSRAFQDLFCIPLFEDFCQLIEKMYWKCKNISTGKVANYIPQLAACDPNYWGVSLCTVDGQRYSIGDVNVPFTLQSVSKPIMYSIALNELGEEEVHNYIGQEPSGRMCNELVLDYNGKPHNPMINTGAIMACSLIHTLCNQGLNRSEKFEFTQNYFKRMAGGEYIGFSNPSFLSERDTADRNYALGYYMKEHKCFPENCNLLECLDYYFQCCALEGNCESLAVIAGTLANGGICPITGERVLRGEAVRDVLSLMHSCGMYDYSGQFAFKIGLPAKSSISGALIIVVPNTMGIAFWSPAIDDFGNSVRGLKFCEELVSTFNFHRFDCLHHSNKKLNIWCKKYETGLNIVTLLFSTCNGDVTALRRHLLSGMDMGQCDYDNRTPLHLAAVEGHLECVKFLVEQCHVEISPKDRWGRTPLDDSIMFNHADVASYLKIKEKEKQKGGNEE